KQIEGERTCESLSKRLDLVLSRLRGPGGASLSQPLRNRCVAVWRRTAVFGPRRSRWWCRWTWNRAWLQCVRAGPSTAGLGTPLSTSMAVQNERRRKRKTHCTKHDEPSSHNPRSRLSCRSSRDCTVICTEGRKRRPAKSISSSRHTTRRRSAPDFDEERIQRLIRMKEGSRVDFQLLGRGALRQTRELKAARGRPPWASWPAYADRVRSRS